jgi:serine O-acetyltransferase
MLLHDMRRDFERFADYASGSRTRRLLACLRAPGLHAAAVYRLGHWALGRPAWARILLDPAYVALNLAVQVLWGIEISRHARLGPGLYIGHFGGITVGSGVVAGANLALSQGVTLGSWEKDQGPLSPRIGDDVYIAPGARVFGDVTIGSNAKIGANAVVYADVPDNAVVALDPGYRVISMRGNRRLAA